MSRRRKLVIVLGIVLGMAILLVVAGLIGWQALMSYFVQQYYRTEYAPIALSAGDIGAYPAEHHLDDVPWIAADIAVCQSTSLQMIAAQHGVSKPRRHFDFLMAFTYGFSEIPGMAGFFPAGTDPEAGLRDAAPCLGLVRRYYVTDDQSLYVRALRYFLAQGYPVRLALDMGALYGASEFIGHSDVLVGYDASGFYYYETVCIPPAPCTPGERAPGDTGLYVPDARLLQAVENQARRFSYPWRYSLTVFEPGPQTVDPRPVWKRLAQATLGGNPYGPATGVAVLEKAAAEIEQRGSGYDVAPIRTGLEMAVRFRQDNARYLREQFPGEADLTRAADLFDRAADRYKATLDAVADGIGDPAEARQVAGWLREAAAAEREVGQIFLARGQ